jgi:hypothetical protein
VDKQRQCEQPASLMNAGEKADGRRRGLYSALMSACQEETVPTTKLKQARRGPEGTSHTSRFVSNGELLR